jgi:hypothetical protein
MYLLAVVSYCKKKTKTKTLPPKDGNAPESCEKLSIYTTGVQHWPRVRLSESSKLHLKKTKTKQTKKAQKPLFHELIEQSTVSFPS